VSVLNRIAGNTGVVIVESARLIEEKTREDGMGVGPDGMGWRGLGVQP